MPHHMSFQYLTPGEDAPRAGYEITDADFEIPTGNPIPRTGEFVQLVSEKGAETYEVLAVTTRIWALGDHPLGLHTVLTVGPVIGDKKATLSMIRE